MRPPSYASGKLCAFLVLLLFFLYIYVPMQRAAVFFFWFVPGSSRIWKACLASRCLLNGVNGALSVIVRLSCLDAHLFCPDLPHDCFLFIATFVLASVARLFWLLSSYLNLLPVRPLFIPLPSFCALFVRRRDANNKAGSRSVAKAPKKTTVTHGTLPPLAFKGTAGFVFFASSFDCER
uniref:Transmembrane protein n=1 Tax=Trypanosoma vivax (strain Y486) TaxID=1055687 RepID=G0UBE8_TRYVY|nr:hypothetical protein TVY486_1106270 [Trypanosoma vivax Y486]